MTTKLPLHEWCIIVLFSLVLLALASFAWARPKPVLDLPVNSTPIMAPVLQVTVEGQVSKPGQYRLPLNATLKQLFEQALPLPSADLTQFNARRKLRDGQTIRIPERRPIVIQISGAVQQPGTLQIMSGTRCCELEDQLQFLPEADLKSFRKRKGFVKEGDLITVPYVKKVKKS